MGFLAAQVVHAAGESVTTNKLPSHTHAVVLAVKDESHLLEIATELQLEGVPHKLIREIDPPYSFQCTAIGIVPLSDRSIVRKILRRLPLLGKIKNTG